MLSIRWTIKKMTVRLPKHKNGNPYLKRKISRPQCSICKRSTRITKKHLLKCNSRICLRVDSHGSLLLKLCLIERRVKAYSLLTIQPNSKRQNTISSIKPSNSVLKDNLKSLVIIPRKMNKIPLMVRFEGKTNHETLINSNSKHMILMSN